MFLLSLPKDAVMATLYPPWTEEPTASAVEFVPPDLRLRLRDPRDAKSWLLLALNDSATMPSKPLTLLKVMFKVPVEPGRRARDPGSRFSVKLVTVSGAVTR